MNALLSKIRSNLNTPMMRNFIIMAAVFSLAAVSLAQTPVPLSIPTNDIFTQTNTWMAVFAPIVAIGIGIAVALAILTFIGNEIVKAFRR